MGALLKDLYNVQFIESLSYQLSIHCDKFDSQAFVQFVFDEFWNGKELKDRMKHISVSLHQFLPNDYVNAICVLKNVSSEFSGFEYMFFPGFVELYGMNYFTESIQALEHFTEYSSSEFAVRPFIKIYGAKMMNQLELWAISDNHHVRRLASEGCRPRLPWAMALPEFKANPLPILPILEILKNDQSDYVRRSVANNLNDISKDNPEIVINLSLEWFGKNKKIDRVVKHGCRTLLKQGDSKILKLFGFNDPEHISIIDFFVQETVAIGSEFSFSFSLFSPTKPLGKLRIEYVIDFVKKNGKLSPKTFIHSESNNSSHKKTIKKTHNFKIISTRKYYTGTHFLGIYINGQEISRKKFSLCADLNSLYFYKELPTTVSGE